MRNVKAKSERKFNGPLRPRDEGLHEGADVLTLKEYCNMQKKHLHAYLMGDTYFRYKGRTYQVE